MTLGTSRPRNWGIEQQSAALAIACKRGRVAYEVRRCELWLHPSDNGIALRGWSVARLENVRRGKWEAHSIQDGRVLATGVSQRDVIRATIEAVWQ